MLGLEIKVVGKTKKCLLKGLQEAIKEIKYGHTNMYIPLNDPDDTEIDYSVCDVGELTVFCDWNQNFVILAKDFN